MILPTIILPKSKSDYDHDNDYDYGDDCDFALLLYQAGVAPLKADALGKLALSREGLHQRNQKVLNFSQNHSKLNVQSSTLDVPPPPLIQLPFNFT